MRRERPWIAYVYAIVAAALLAMPALLNRAPIFYEDTQHYLSRPAAALFEMSSGRLVSPWVNQEKIAKWMASPAADGAGEAGFREQWMAGRSAYWGFIAYGFVLLLGGWGIVAMNALLAGTVLSLVWCRCFNSLSPLLFAALLLALAFLTPLGAMVAFVTPDLLSGLMVLGISCLALGWARLHAIDVAALGGVAAFAVISHDSHLAIAAIITPFALLFAWRSGAIPARRRMVWAAMLVAPLAAGLLANAAFSQMAQSRTGAPPLRLPHLTAQIVSLPAGQRFLAERCKGAPFAICAYADRLPVHWIAFLFDESAETGVFGAASDAEKRRLSGEQYRFALAVGREYPLALLGELAGQGLQQVTMLGLADLDQRAKAPYFIAEFPPAVFEGIRGSLLWREPGLLVAFDRISLASTVLGTALLVGVFLLRLKRKLVLPGGLIWFTALVLVGVLANDFVCGVLASPLGRFNARIIWVVPFLGLALLGYAANFAARKGSEGRVRDA